MLQALELHQVPMAAEHRSSEGIPWPQIYGHYLEQCQTVYDAIKAMPHLRPDLVVAHGGRGAPTLVPPRGARLPDHQSIANITSRPAIATSRTGSTCRRPSRPRSFRAASTRRPWRRLVDCDAGYSATHWQKQSFPARFHSKIEVHFDGIDTELYRPGPAPRRIGERVDPAGHEGRHVRLARAGVDPRLRPVHEGRRPDRPGSGPTCSSSWSAARRSTTAGTSCTPASPSFKQWVLSQGSYDLSRFLFLGRILPEQLADILRLSDLHIYLTAPFVLSWSLFNAMASGCVVLASDVPPVREVIEPGENGLVEPLFDVDRLTETRSAGPRRPGRLRPAGPRRPPHDRGEVQPRDLHPADQGLLRESGEREVEPLSESVSLSRSSGRAAR